MHILCLLVNALNTYLSALDNENQGKLVKERLRTPGAGICCTGGRRLKWKKTDV